MLLTTESSIFFGAFAKQNSAGDIHKLRFCCERMGEWSWNAKFYADVELADDYGAYLISSSFLVQALHDSFVPRNYFRKLPSTRSASNAMKFTMTVADSPCYKQCRRGQPLTASNATYYAPKIATIVDRSFNRIVAGDDKQNYAAFLYHPHTIGLIEEK